MRKQKEFLWLVCFSTDLKSNAKECKKTLTLLGKGRTCIQRMDFSVLWNLRVTRQELSVCVCVCVCVYVCLRKRERERGMRVKGREGGRKREEQSERIEMDGKRQSGVDQ